MTYHELWENNVDKVVDELLRDLADRSGLGDSWYNIDTETRDEIRDEWRGIIIKHIEEIP